MGRPSEFKDRKMIGGCIEKSEYEALEEIRWREHKDFSELLRLMVQEYIKNHSEGNDTFTMDNWQVDPSFKAIPSLFGSDDKWKICFKNSSFEERTNLMIRLKYLRELLVFIDSNMEDRHSWKRIDLPVNTIPTLRGDP